MNAPSVTQEQISALLSASRIDMQTIHDKVTLVSVKLPSGFVLTASSGAVSAENYDSKIGYKVCMKQIEDELWKLEGYALQKRMASGLGPVSDESVIWVLLKKQDALQACKNRLETIREPAQRVRRCDPV